MQLLPSDEFLTKKLGLIENPFLDTRADDEAQLPKYFVDLSAFYRILDTDTGRPKSSILSASRGCGKSANRLNVERWLKQGPNMGFSGKWPWKSPTLVALYQDFDRLRSYVDGDFSKIRPLDHVNSILWVSVSSLLDHLKKNWEMDQVRNIDRWVVSQLGFFLVNYSDEWAYLGQELDPNIGSEFESVHDLNGFLTAACRLSQRAQNLKKSGSTSLLQAFKRVAEALGIQSIVVLVDGVDELDITADDPQLGALLLKPLLAERTILEMDGLYFKFFLPSQIVVELKKMPETRLGERMNYYEMAWDEDSIQKLLTERLKVFSNGALRDLGQLATPEVTNVGNILALHANNNPRNLFRLGNWLLRHLEQSSLALQTGSRQIKPRITKAIVDAAITSFETDVDQDDAYATMGVTAPNKGAMLISRGGWEITPDLHALHKGKPAQKLDRKEYELFAYLIDKPEQLVSREELGRAVWKDKWVSKYDWVLTQTMSRLRKKIGDPVIETVRGMGYIFHEG